MQHSNALSVQVQVHEFAANIPAFLSRLLESGYIPVTVLHPAAAGGRPGPHLGCPNPTLSPSPSATRWWRDRAKWTPCPRLPQTQRIYPSAMDSVKQYRIIPEILSDGTFHEETHRGDFDRQDQEEKSEY